MRECNKTFDNPLFKLVSSANHIIKYSTVLNYEKVENQGPVLQKKIIPPKKRSIIIIIIPFFFHESKLQIMNYDHYTWCERNIYYQKKVH